METIQESFVDEKKLTEGESVLRLESLPYHTRRRLEVLQRLEQYRKTEQYAQEQLRAMQELGVSLRSLQRMLRLFREKGVESLVRRTRIDQGKRKVKEEWQKFILKTYRQGNRRGMCKSPSQVAIEVQSRAAELGESDYPSRRTVYRLLEPEIKARSQKQKIRAIGWRGDLLKLTTREGIEIEIEYSNQVWQCDHTPADILVVDQQGDILGRPTLTTVIDTYSRCIMGMHLGIGYPSAAVTCLALRHAILPKQYSPSYELTNLWGTYGLPQYLYTDGGSDFTSSHIDQTAAELGITLCLRKKPSDGGIVERPFGTFNSEFFSTLPGYTTSRLEPHRAKVEAEACLTLHQLEQRFVRYIVDRYNQLPDPRVSHQTRLTRWEEGRIAHPPLLSERELDILLMRKDRRRVYKGGHIKFANLVYKGEYLAGYAGEQVVLRYNPRDITTILIYRQRGAKDVFLTRAHAQHLQAERLSLAEAQAISRRLREASKKVTNRSVLTEVSARTRFVDDLLLKQATLPPADPPSAESPPSSTEPETDLDEPAVSKPLPDIQVYDYEQLRQDHGL